MSPAPWGLVEGIKQKAEADDQDGMRPEVLDPADAAGPGPKRTEGKPSSD